METINQYLYRGTKPRPMPTPAPKRISTPAGARLSTIVEGNSNNAAANDARRQRPANRSLAQRLNLGAPPRASFEKRPPSYATQDGLALGDLEGAAYMEKPPESSWIRENLKSRGGWKRLALILGVILVVIIALAVGLGVGLSHDSDGSGGDGNSGPSQPQPFPAGSWAFDTALMETSTDCTSNADSWTCFSSTAGTSFNWIIKPASSSSSSASSDFLISSSPNPFSTVFDNIPLHLSDANTPDEHYSFSIPRLSKVVYPEISLTGDNNRTICYFNDTILSANIYTRRKGDLNVASGMARLPGAKMAPVREDGMSYQSWTHAVEIAQVASRESDVPSCYRTYDGHAVGQPMTFPARSSAATDCRCGYSNFDSSSSS